MTDRYQINAWISRDAAQRLKRMAHERKQSYGEFLTRLILEIPNPVDASDWQTAVAGLEARLSRIEAQLSTIVTDSETVSRETLSTIAADSESDTIAVDSDNDKPLI